MFDTTAGEGDVSAVLALPELPGAPSFEIAWGGPIAALQASYDVSSLKSNISVGALSKGIDKLEELQREQERILAEEQAYARDQAIKVTERMLRRQAREAAAEEARRQAEERARLEDERQARLIADAEARQKVDDERRRIEERQRQEEAQRQEKQLEEEKKKAEAQRQHDAERKAHQLPAFGQSSDLAPIDPEPMPPVTSTLGPPQAIAPIPNEADMQKAKDQHRPKSQDEATPWPGRRNVREGK
jgi:hypothetical protein